MALPSGAGPIFTFAPLQDRFFDPASGLVYPDVVALQTRASEAGVTAEQLNLEDDIEAVAGGNSTVNVRRSAYNWVTGASGDRDFVSINTLALTFQSPLSALGIRLFDYGDFTQLRRAPDLTFLGFFDLATADLFVELFNNDVFVGRSQVLDDFTQRNGLSDWLEIRSFDSPFTELRLAHEITAKDPPIDRITGQPLGFVDTVVLEEVWAVGATVPSPSSVALLGLGFALFLCRTHHRGFRFE